MRGEPIFKAIFGADWDRLPIVMKKHYANRPNSSDVVTVKGALTIRLSWFYRLLSPLLKISKTLVPVNGENVPTMVHFRSEPRSNAFCFDRHIHMPGVAPLHFFSRMVPAGGDEMIEHTGIGLAWHCRFRFDGKRVLLEHLGYVTHIFGRRIRLPLEWVLGKGGAWEEAVSDDTFAMYIEIRHFLLGRLYTYSGSFTVVEMALDD